MGWRGKPSPAPSIEAKLLTGAVSNRESSRPNKTHWIQYRCLVSRRLSLDAKASFEALGCLFDPGWLAYCSEACCNNVDVDDVDDPIIVEVSVGHVELASPCGSKPGSYESHINDVNNSVPVD